MNDKYKLGEAIAIIGTQIFVRKLSAADWLRNARLIFPHGANVSIETYRRWSKIR
jgi:hypothetical protein